LQTFPIRHVDRDGIAEQDGKKRKEGRRTAGEGWREEKRREERKGKEKAE
jgi:hypothetical protein